MSGTLAASYRLQLHSGFGFSAAAEIADYLTRLGISEVYASPILAARPGSGHGYDVIDPGRLNPELGGEDDFAALMARTREAGLGWIQDIVPNHMAFTSDNPMLMDVMENGVYSRYKDFFDIDWEHPDETINGKLLAPFLGRFYGACLEDGEIRLGYEDGSFFVSYYEHRFPLCMSCYPRVLEPGFRRLKSGLGEDNPDYVKYLGVLYVLKTLSEEPGSEERYGQVAFVKRVLRDLYEENVTLRAFIDANVESFNGEPGRPETFDALDGLLSEQHFRLAYWKVATEEINYRRFFNINELISLKIQGHDVFRRTHEMILRLHAEYGFSGLRVDHVDGLYDPLQYLERLSQEAGGVDIWAEKILEHGEPLPEYWPVAGTTGYDFLNAACGVLVKKKNGPAFRRIYREFTGLETDYDELVSDKKRLIIGKEMAGDVNNLAMTIKRAFGHFRHGRDITLYGLRRALVEVLANFPVYRTYFDERRARDVDAKFMAESMDKAAGRLPAMANEFGFLKELFLAGPEEFRDSDEYRLKLDTVMRFQQYSGPLMAKGFEDTLLYVYNRLLALNEVGGAPDRFGWSISEFHSFMRERKNKWPRAMNATATHDTKRGEDARARLAVLSEIPREWRAKIKVWRRMNRGRKVRVAGRAAPDANDEYFLYQILLAAWPFGGVDSGDFKKRLEPIVVKCLREAKVYTAWTMPDEDYEAATIEFLSGMLEDPDFTRDFAAFRDKVSFYGALNSFSQTLIKLAAPGIPDFYQGTELWDFSMVDPDNRRPVDYGLRREMLRKLGAAETGPGFFEGLLDHYRDGRAKMFLIMRGLAARKDNPDLFAKGDYVQLKTEGAFRDNVVAFARRLDRAWALAVTPRFCTELTDPGEFPLGTDVWMDTAVSFPKNAPRTWIHAVTGETVSGDGRIPVAGALSRFPAALLIGKK
jgi:(1->4)-alpha-D-glucan 1-alpha-D-glucosylmutase